MIKKLFLIPAIGLSLLSFGTAQADSHMGNQSSCQCSNQPGENCNCSGPSMPKKGCGCGKMKRDMQSLNLTDEQKTEISNIKQASKAQMKPIYEQMKALKLQMYQLVNTEKMEPAKITPLVDKMKELYAQKLRAKLAMKNQMFNILTPEQKNQFLSSMQSDVSPDSPANKTLNLTPQGSN